MTNISTQTPAAVVLSAIATVKRGPGRPKTEGPTRQKLINGFPETKTEPAKPGIKELVAKRGGTTYGMGLAQLRLADLQAIWDGEMRLAFTH
jgi:hypothetical protein